MLEILEARVGAGQAFELETTNQRDHRARGVEGLLGAEAFEPLGEPRSEPAFVGGELARQHLVAGRSKDQLVLDEHHGRVSELASRNLDDEGDQLAGRGLGHLALEPLEKVEHLGGVVAEGLAQELLARSEVVRRRTERHLRPAGHAAVRDGVRSTGGDHAQRRLQDRAAPPLGGGEVSWVARPAEQPHCTYVQD